METSPSRAKLSCTDTDRRALVISVLTIYAHPALYKHTARLPT